MRVSRWFRCLGSALLAVGFNGAVAHAAVWPSENQWSTEWEEKYSRWVKSNWDENFFARPGTPYSGLYLDCADTVYSMRVIFSFENRLPFAMQDPSGGKKLITNEMTRFDSLSTPEQRIRKFLKFIYQTASTSSLPNDTYPVALNRQEVRSGRLILTDHESHHSWTIKELKPEGIPHLIFGSLPAKNVLLVRLGQPSVEFTFHGQLNPARHAGFRAFRRVEDLGKPVWKSEGYSDEQYRVPVDAWMSTVKKRLSLVEESPESLLRRTIDTACLGVRERVVNVNEGLDALGKLRADRCFSAEEYDNYSTPNRDMRLRNSFEELRDAWASIQASRVRLAQVPSTLLREAQDVMSDAFSASNSQRVCPVEVTPGRVVSLAEVRRRSLNGLLSSNPHDPLEFRWGDRAGLGQRAERCPKFE